MMISLSKSYSEGGSLVDSSAPAMDLDNEPLPTVIVSHSNSDKDKPSEASSVDSSEVLDHTQAPKNFFMQFVGRFISTPPQFTVSPNSSPGRVESPASPRSRSRSLSPSPKTNKNTNNPLSTGSPSPSPSPLLNNGQSLNDSDKNSQDSQEWKEFLSNEEEVVKINSNERTFEKRFLSLFQTRSNSNANGPAPGPAVTLSANNNNSLTRPRPSSLVDYNTPLYRFEPFVNFLHKKYVYAGAVMCESIYRAQHSSIEALQIIKNIDPAIITNNSISLHLSKSQSLTVLQAENPQKKTFYLIVPGTRLMTSNLWKLATNSTAQSHLAHDINTNCQLQGINFDLALTNPKQNNTQTKVRTSETEIKCDESNGQMANEKENSEILSDLKENKENNENNDNSTVNDGNGSVHNGFWNRALDIELEEAFNKWKSGYTIIFVGHSSGGAVAHLLLLRLFKIICTEQRKLNENVDSEGNEKKHEGLDIIDDDNGSILDNRVLSIAFGAPFFGDLDFANYADRINLSKLMLTLINDQDVMSSLLDYEQPSLRDGAILNKFSRPIRDWLLIKLGVNPLTMAVPPNYQPVGIYAIQKPYNFTQLKEALTLSLSNQDNPNKPNQTNQLNPNENENEADDNNNVYSLIPSPLSIRRRLSCFSFNPFQCNRAHQMKLYLNHVKHFKPPETIDEILSKINYIANPA